MIKFWKNTVRILSTNDRKLGGKWYGKKKLFAFNEQMISELPGNVLGEFLKAMAEHVGDVKLDKEAREDIKNKLGVDDKIADYLCILSNSKVTEGQ